MSGFDLRTASEKDVGTCSDLFFASYNDLHRRYGHPQEDPGDRGWLVEGLRHLLRTDPSGTVLAVRGEQPMGFATAYRRETFWFLSFLFVAPDAQGGGVGRALLEALVPLGSDALTRALVVESFQPVSTGLYASHGIVPLSLRYWLEGLPDPGRLPDLPHELETEDLTTEDLPEVDTLDRLRLGYARPEDHRWWLSIRPTGRAFRRGGRLVGYGYRAEDGDVCPALGWDEDTLCAVVADLIRDAPEPSAASVPLYGNARGVFRMLVRAGARIAPESYRFVYCSDGDPLPRSYVGYGGYLI